MAKAKKRPAKVVQMPHSVENLIRVRARNLALGDCYINADWKEAGEAIILITRKHNEGNLTMAVFLIEMIGSGLVQSYYWFNFKKDEFARFLADLYPHTKPAITDYALAHNIVYGAVEFTESLGLRLPAEFKVAEYVLEEDSEDIEIIDIPFGEDAGGGRMRLGDVFEREDADPKEVEKYVVQVDWPSLFEKCRRLFDMAPWEDMFEDEVFGIRLVGNKEYYVSVMGSGGEFRAISFYEDPRAFNVFWDMVEDRGLNYPGKILSAAHFMISWDDESHLDPLQRAVFDRFNLKFGEGEWLNIEKVKPGFVHYFPDIRDFKTIDILLDQCLEVLPRRKTEKGLLGFDIFNDMFFRIARKQGDEVVWEEKVKPIKREKPKYDLNYDHELLTQYNKLKIGFKELQIDFRVLPAPVRGERNRHTLPFVMMMYDEKADKIVDMQLIEIEKSLEHTLKDLMNIYMRMCLKVDKRPARLLYDNNDLEMMMFHLRIYTKTVTKRSHELDVMNQVFENLSEALQGPRG